MEKQKEKREKSSRLGMENYNKSSIFFLSLFEMQNKWQN